jgi:hypothetical protein
VVYALSGTTYRPTPLDCLYCGQFANPRADNCYTKMLASQQGPPGPDNTALVDYVNTCGTNPELAAVVAAVHAVGSGLAPPPVVAGPGTELKKLLAWFSPPRGSCQCEIHRYTMDVWGPARCRERRATIIQWVLAEGEELGWPTGRLARHAIGVLVDRAIRTAEKQENR